MHYSPVRRSPSGPKPHAAARLACVKRAASVQSEPGSNSSVKRFDCLALRLLHGCGGCRIETAFRRIRKTSGRRFVVQVGARAYWLFMIVKERPPEAAGVLLYAENGDFERFMRKILIFLVRFARIYPNLPNSAPFFGKFSRRPPPESAGRRRTLRPAIMKKISIQPDKSIGGKR